jgi:hypothetical protein
MSSEDNDAEYLERIRANQLAKHNEIRVARMRKKKKNININMQSTGREVYEV